MKKYTFKSLKKAPQEVLKQLEELEKQLLAKADPQYLKQFSELMGREVNDVKDTEDYNMDLVSSVLDRSIKPFMEAGQVEIKTGDYLKLDNKIDSKDLKEDFKKGLEGSYESFPFSQLVEAELRTKYLLKTNSSDTFTGLLSQLENKILNYCSPFEWNILKQAVLKAESRLKNEKILFPGAIKKNKTTKFLSFVEKFGLNIKKEVDITERPDGHDLLSLKELVNIVQGEKVDPLTIGPGFFTKYMPELKQLGFDGVILKVKENKLEKIKVVKLIKRGLYYSPIEASVLLHYSEAVDLKDVNFKGVDNKTHNHTQTLVNRPEFLTEDLRYYVIVDGCVATPQTKTPYNYESFANNNQRVKAGETFLFENQGGEVVQTRLYFYPYKPSEIHLLHQHGSVIFGSNDQSYQSCLNQDAIKDMWSLTVIDRYKQWWSQRQKEESFSPAVIAAKVHNFLVDKDGKSTSSTDLLKEENYEHLKNVIHSVSEVNEFSKEEILYNLPLICFTYGGANRDWVRKLSANYAPLSRRWLLKKYIEDGAGLTKETQPTYYVQLAKKMRSADSVEFLREYSKIKVLKEKIKSGEDYIQAYNDVYKKVA